MRRMWKLYPRYSREEREVIVLGGQLRRFVHGDSQMCVPFGNQKVPYAAAVFQKTAGETGVTSL